jgi:hypothetical protein
LVPLLNIWSEVVPRKSDTMLIYKCFIVCASLSNVGEGIDYSETTIYTTLFKLFALLTLFPVTFYPWLFIRDFFSVTLFLVTFFPTFVVPTDCCHLCFVQLPLKGLSRLYGSRIYNYLCHQCLSSLERESRCILYNIIWYTCCICLIRTPCWFKFHSVCVPQ